MRYFVYLAYDGANYHGWQIQPNGNSVQETLQKGLSTLLRCPIEVVGAGRTDAGVHAKLMVAHFDGENVDCSQLTYKLNKILPLDISIYKIVPVAADAHARFDATSRTYHYFVNLEKSPFSRAYSTRLFGSLDFNKMNEAAQVLMEYIDFTSFSKVNTDTKTNNCTITKAIWEEIEPGQWRFTITANRFLRNMVRAIVGTLIEVGRGKMTIDSMRRVIEAKNRCQAGESVPGNALFLVDIKYPEKCFKI